MPNFSVKEKIVHQSVGPEEKGGGHKSGKTRPLSSKQFTRTNFHLGMAGSKNAPKPNSS